MDKTLKEILEVLDKLISIKMQEGSYWLDDLYECRTKVRNLKDLIGE